MYKDELQDRKNSRKEAMIHLLETDPSKVWKTNSRGILVGKLTENVLLNMELMDFLNQLKKIL